MATKIIDRKTVRRASDRTASTVNIDASYRPLMRLMIEQCSQNWNYLTVYRGTRQQLSEAGVPENAFPSGKAKRRPFRVRLGKDGRGSVGRREDLGGSMRKVDEQQFELELQWGSTRPHLCHASHPALTELGRMLLSGVMKYADDWDHRLEQPFEVLALNPEAVDYKPGPGSPKFKVTPEFHAALREEAGMYLYNLVQSRGEIMLVDEERPKQEPRHDDNVVTLKSRRVGASKS